MRSKKFIYDAGTLVGVMLILSCRGETATEVGFNPIPVLAHSMRDTESAGTGSCTAQAGCSQETDKDEKKEGFVATKPERLCGRCADDESKSGDAAVNDWLKPDDIQKSIGMLHRELEDFSEFVVGETFDNKAREAVVVFHQDFAEYERLAALPAKVAPLRVVFRDACHSRKQMEEAQAVMEARDWHPSARKAGLGWYLEASFAGYCVTVDSDYPEVAQALRQRLGNLVLVSLGKPRRDSKSAK